MGNQISKEAVIHVTLGTAGHIDHGKSALVHRLTGMHPDRFKEEQIRGMTIDLGYAFYVTRQGARVGVIDVPGHERFIKNMVTGASAIDVVVLVVAADDGVMPQTREHLEIMTVMGIRSGLVALTKIDLVDEEMAALARADIEDLVAGTFLEGSPIVPVSSETGEGLDRFVTDLEEIIHQAVHISHSGLFRLPVQRVFSAKGFGTVVTGVPISGAIKVGDPVEILPQGIMGKVRGLQSFNRQYQEGRAGCRVAVNIADVEYRSLTRGCTVAVPGFFRPTMYFEGFFSHFASTGLALKNISEVKVHAGTAEVMGKVVLLNTKTLKPGEGGFVQLRLTEPMVLSPGDRFLLRRHSPPLSLGGGTVLRSSSSKARRFREPLMEELATRHERLGGEIQSFIAFEISRWKGGFFSPRDIAETVGQEVDTVQAVVDSLSGIGEVLESSRGLRIHKDRYHALAQEVETALEDLHRALPLKPFLDINPLRSRVNLEETTLQELLKIMEKDERVETAKGGRIRKAGFEVHLEPEQEALAATVGKIIEEAGLSPPAMEALSDKTGADRDRLLPVLDYLVTVGEIQPIAGFYVNRKIMEQLITSVIQCAREHGEVKIPLIRDAFSTTRKYLIPIMEYLDDLGITRREGDRRYLVGDL